MSLQETKVDLKLFHFLISLKKYFTFKTKDAITLANHNCPHF